MGSVYRLAHSKTRELLLARLSKLTDGIIYTERRGLAKGMRRKGGLGFLPSFALSGTFKTPEYEFMRRLQLKDAIVYDIGALHGIMTMYFSQQASNVIAYEPNPKSNQRLREHLVLNNISNVTVRDVAIGNKKGKCTLTVDPLLNGTATANDQIAEQMRTGSVGFETIEVDMVTLDDDIEQHKLPVPDFIKIDIEGMEIPALLGMNDTIGTHRPRLYVEVHGATSKEKSAIAQGILQLVTQAGYRNVFHVESSKWVEDRIVNSVIRGHFYCEA